MFNYIRAITDANLAVVIISTSVNFLFTQEKCMFLSTSYLLNLKVLEVRHWDRMVYRVVDLLI